MSANLTGVGPVEEANFAAKAGWALYDWANSGYGLVVITAVFPGFFISRLLPLLPGSGDHGVVAWGTQLPGDAVIGILNSLSMLLMALGAPVLGAIADIRGWAKRLLVISATTGSIFTLAMYFLRPGDWIWGSLLFVGSNFCYGTSFTFYNAYLPRLTRPEKQGSLSGWGFATGYVGGAVALVLALVLIKQGKVELALALSGAWWLIFSLPAFIFLKEFEPQESGPGSIVLEGFRRVGHTFRNIRQYRVLFVFLLAFLLYNDGVETVISMSPAYGTAVLGLSQEDLALVFLIVQFIAFAGAALFGYLSDKLGHKEVIQLNLLVWVLAVAGAYLVRSTTEFFVIAALIGVVLGGIQASSRSLMASLTPARIQNEAFGFFSISGKFASIFGPLLYAAFATGARSHGLSPRTPVLSVVPFLLVGFLVLLKVPDPRRGDKVTGRQGDRVTG
ncbi:MAG: MFS transporter [Acidobacteriota bacterium]